MLNLKEFKGARLALIHRTAISNERMVAITEREVVLSVRADDAGHKRRIRLPGTEFIRRFMRHVLPKGIKRIRHYGLLASACKTTRLAQARQALDMPALQAKLARLATRATQYLHTSHPVHEFGGRFQRFGL